MAYKPQQFTITFSVDDATKDIPRNPNSLIGRGYKYGTVFGELIEHFYFMNTK